MKTTNSPTQQPASAAHTPQNWYARPGVYPHYQGQIADSVTGETVAITYNDEGGDKADLIMTACNAYDANQRTIAELRAALENIVGLWNDSEQNNGLASIMATDARAVLAKAQEVQP